MEIFIDPTSTTGLTNQVFEEIRSGILEGRVGPGERLPSTRELAVTLGVSRHTVTTAFQRLSAEGFIEGRRGGGTIVSDLSGFRAVLDRSERALDSSGLDEEAMPAFDLRPGTPDPRLFPTAEWRRYARWAVDQHDATYGDPAGVADLRRVLARWVARSRGVDASFRQLIVTSGAQQAFFLLIRACTEPGDVIAMEDPGYNRFRRMSEANGLEVVPIPVDSEGLVVDAIPPNVKLVHVTPSHQFPTGVTMSMARRLDLLSMAHARGVLIVEDDYDSEFRYVDRPLEPLYRLDRTGSVAYVATFSKTLSPALRLGYVVVPQSLHEQVLEVRRQVDWAPSHVDQLTLRGYIADGHLEGHLRRTRRIYMGRQQRMTAFLERAAAQGVLRPAASNAGLHISAGLSPALEEAKIMARLAERGVAIEGYAEYSSIQQADGGLVFGFGLVDSDQLEEAIRIVADVIGVDD
ncbi:MAG TPA: PLP-dependent aminotransferase family protein [Acidimicrobiia bacterium]|nr:PLP-dependent aminotransferase family protein [Acidimicrobiia bacterium]